MPTLRIDNLGGGLNQTTPELIQDTECQACENVDFNAIFGAFATRKGSLPLNSSVLPAAVLSNFKLYNPSASYRYTQAGTTQFRNFVSFKTSLAAKKSVAVGFRNQAFFSDSSTMWADDGTSASGYPWGITPPAAAPKVSAGSQPYTQIATFESSESWTCLEGAQSYDTSTFKQGTACLSLIADATRYNAISTHSFASPLDLSVNSGTTVDGHAAIQIWLWVSNGVNLQSITLRFDCNDGTFQKDYYTGVYNPYVQDEQAGDVRSEMNYRLDIPLIGMRQQLANSNTNRSTSRNSIAIANNSWTLVTLPVTSFERTGQTTGTGWGTIQAVMVSFQGAGAITVKFDDLKLIGNKNAALNNSYVYVETFQHRDSNGNLLNESNGSPLSTPLQQQYGLGVLTSTNSTTNSMVTHRGFYRIGGSLDQAYLVGTMTYASGTATFTDTVADLDLLYANIPLATDNNVAPNGYYLVEGPHYDRIFAGSGITLRWTKTGMPHSWPSTNSADLPHVQSGDFIKRIIKSMGRLFIFTNSSVFELLGDSEDNFEIRKTLSKTGTPAEWSVCDVGDALMYIGGQGTNILGLFIHNGLVDHKISFEKLQPFFCGRTLNGVAALNTLSASNCFAVYHRNSYWLAYPAGTSLSANKILKIDFGRYSQPWGPTLGAVPVSIYSYSLPATITSLDVELVDGLLSAGGSDGFLYQLETGSTDDGLAIDWYWRSKNVRLGQTLDRHPIWSVRANMNSNGQEVTFSGYVDSSYGNSVLGVESTEVQEWTPQIKGETTEVPRDNFALELSGSCIKEILVHRLEIESVNFK